MHFQDGTLLDAEGAASHLGQGAVELMNGVHDIQQHVVPNDQFALQGIDITIANLTSSVRHRTQDNCIG